MCRKSRFLFALFLLLFSSLPLSAAILSPMSKFAEGAYKEFDAPLVSGLTYFMDMFYSFQSIALKIANFIGLIGVLWHVLQLWFSTEQVKKAVVDILFKFLLFIFCFNVYNSVIFGIFNIATNIGMAAGGGQKLMVKQFEDLYKDAKNKAAAAYASIATELYTKGITTIDAKTAAVLAERSSMSLDDFEKQNSHITVIDFDEEINEAKNSNNLAAQRKLSAQRSAASVRNAEKIAKKFQKDEYLSQAITRLNAFNEILNVTEEERQSGIPAGAAGYGQSEEIVRQFVYDPFIYFEKSNGEKQKSGILSPGAMIKTAVLVADVVASSVSFTYDKTQKSLIKKIIDNSVASIFNALMALLMPIVIVLAACFFVIQYVMCVFEYFLVTSIGVIFLPFMLFDGTKSFAAKLITLFSAYFIKLMVMIICVFWAFAQFLQAGTYIWSSNNPIGFLTVSYFIFTVLLCWVVTQNAPQIAVTLLNGTPQLSMGEFLHAAGTAVAGAALARKGADKIKEGAQKLGHGAQGVARGFQTLDAINKGAKSYSAQMKEMGSERSTGSLERGYIAGQLLQGAKNKAGSILTGVEKEGTGVGSYNHKDASGANSRMTHADAVKAQEGHIAAEQAEKKMKIERERIAARDNQPNPTSNKGMRNGGANGFPDDVHYDDFNSVSKGVPFDHGGGGGNAPGGGGGGGSGKGGST